MAHHQNLVDNQVKMEAQEVSLVNSNKLREFVPASVQSDSLRAFGRAHYGFRSLQFSGVPAWFATSLHEVHGNGEIHTRVRTATPSLTEQDDSSLARSTFGLRTVQLRSADGNGVFTIHKDLLCSNSCFFHGALHGSFLGASLDVLDTDAETVTLAVAVDWMYHGTLPTSIPNIIDHITWHRAMLLQIYIFADKYGFDKLRLYIMKRWQQRDLRDKAPIRKMPETKLICKI
ncbi:hypothetical protein K402DRAFT_222094 [Aulographum hederae CBS 113979]|uniref:BTB domain-containing protein n=1 Tax=Aulographum hederae CBS 113979 TaxID=1176131 RepID=A0A6G1GLW5_9PEZI|nr:hypothetical protein K402DRAFT_222094 [Aulographum hederae CBS 113979]